MDFIKDGKAHGSVAQKLLAANMNPAVLRPWMHTDGNSYITVNGKKFLHNASTLRKDEWKQYDDALVKVVGQQKTGVADLKARGLVYSIAGMGKTVLESETQGTWGEAHLSMDGMTRGNNDRPESNIGYLPLPIVHSDFQVNARQLAASRNGGSPLDTDGVENATRLVMEKVETMLFQGASAYKFGGGIIRGYADHPDRNTQSIGTAWSADTGAEILSDVQTAMATARDDRAYGPYVLYVPSNFWAKMGDDYVSGYPKTIRERLLELPDIADIRTSQFITASNVFLVQMTSNVVRLVEGMGLTVVEWDVEGGFATNYKVMAIQVPQIRSDHDLRSGIVHIS